MRKIGFAVIALLLFSQAFDLFSQNEVAWQKQGGLAIRIDDTQPAAHWASFCNLLRNYHVSAMFSVNLGTVNPEQIVELHTMVAQGFSLADHTPNHDTTYFTVGTDADAAGYIGVPGVDHVIGHKVCLQVGTLDGSITANYETTVSVGRDTIYSTDAGGFRGTWGCIYLPELNFIGVPIVKKNLNSSDRDTLVVKNLWGETVNIPAMSGVSYQLLGWGDNSIRMSDDAVRLMLQRSRTLCDAYGLPRFTAWVQPGGDFPVWSVHQRKDIAGGEFGYDMASSGYDAVPMSYSANNADGTCPYRMCWGYGYFDELTAREVIANISRISGLHTLCVGGGHFRNWSLFLERADSVLTWCRANNVPVLSQEQWKNQLFSTLENPNQNVFPAMERDLDQDGSPDGWTLFSGAVTHATSDSGSIVATYTGVAGHAFDVYKLAGFEKGLNRFSVRTRGSTYGWYYVSVTEHPSERVSSFHHTITTAWRTQCDTLRFLATTEYVTFTLYLSGTGQYEMQDFWLSADGYPDAAVNPLPADNATDVSLTPTLSWQSGENTGTGYLLNLYRPDSAAVIEQLDLGDVMSFVIPEPLLHNHTYVWQIIPYKDSSAATGERARRLARRCPRWTFDTVGYIAAPLVSIHADSVLGQVQLDWTCTTVCAHFRVYSASNPSAPFPDAWSLVETVPGNVFTLTLPITGERMFYRVTGYN